MLYADEIQYHKSITRTEVLFHLSFEGAVVVIFLFIVVICAESNVIFRWHKWKVGLESRPLPEWDTYEQASIQAFHHLQNLGFENLGIYSPFSPLTTEFAFLLKYFSLSTLMSVSYSYSIYCRCQISQGGKKPRVSSSLIMSR